MNKNKDYLITEKPSRALFAFALPMIIGNLFQQAYTIVDSAIVGHYVGETALAAVGASYALTSIFICVAIGGGIGASVIISQHFGGHAYSRMKTSIRTAMLSFLLISLMLGGIGLCFSRQIMEALNTPADAMDIAVIYLNIYFYGLPFLFMYNILSSMFNALGESRIPLYLLIFSAVFFAFVLFFSADLLLGAEHLSGSVHGGHPASRCCRCRLRDLYCPGYLGGLLLPDLPAHTPPVRRESRNLVQ